MTKEYGREYMRKYLPLWRENHKEKVKEYAKKNSANRTKKYDSRFKKRFEILEKFDFTCMYCGRRPPEIVLEVDHIFPKSKGGGNEKENLTVACRDCNQGKSNIIIKSAFR